MHTRLTRELLEEEKLTGGDIRKLIRKYSLDGA
jgi:hypothetical protein